MLAATSGTVAGGSGSPQIAGRPARKMCAFSQPIRSRVSPRYSMWSMSTLVSSAQSASKALTASRRPPRPISSTSASGPARSNATMAARVPNSK